MATLTGVVRGTFSGTGQSDDIHVGERGQLTLSFAGTATVKLQYFSVQANAFINTGDIFTETGVFNIDGRGRQMRLDCTAHTNNVDFEIFS